MAQQTTGKVKGGSIFEDLNLTTDLSSRSSADSKALISPVSIENFAKNTNWLMLGIMGAIMVGGILYINKKG